MPALVRPYSADEALLCELVHMFLGIALVHAKCRGHLHYRLFQAAQHECDEGRALGFVVALAGGIVILLLVLFDDGLYRQPSKDGVPAHEQSRLPHTPHTAVAVGKGMDELKLVVEHTGVDERV